VVPGGQPADTGTADTAALAVLRPSSGAADTAAAASPVDAMRPRRVSSDRGAGVPGSGVGGVIGVAFPVMVSSCGRMAGQVLVARAVISAEWRRAAIPGICRTPRPRRSTVQAE
jgi:hypothetical protein